MRSEELLYQTDLNFFTESGSESFKRADRSIMIDIKHIINGKPRSIHPLCNFAFCNPLPFHFFAKLQNNNTLGGKFFCFVVKSLLLHKFIKVLTDTFHKYIVQYNVHFVKEKKF